MKGLLIKDCKLLKTQRLFLCVIFGICIMLLLWDNQRLSAVMTYASTVLSLLVINTVGYDEADNGMSFLLTFPISRSKYVLEKYVLGLLITAAALIAGSVLVLLMGAAGSLPFGMALEIGGGVELFFTEEWLISVLGSLLTSALIISVSMPVQLKFGSEKSRVVMFGGVVLFLLGASAGKKAAEVLGIDFSAVMEWVMQADAVQVTVCLCAAMAVMLVGSYFISLAIMKRKQF